MKDISYNSDLKMTNDIINNILNDGELLDIDCDSLEDIVCEVLDFYGKYYQTLDLIEADMEFENGEGICFSSMEELVKYLDN